MDTHKHIIGRTLFASGDLETASQLFEAEREHGQASDPAVLHSLGIIYNLQGKFGP